MKQHKNSIQESNAGKKLYHIRNITFTLFMLAMIAICAWMLQGQQPEEEKPQQIVSQAETAVAAQPQTPVPTAMPEPEKITQAYVQLEDPLLVLVNRIVSIPRDYEMMPRQYDNIIVDNRIYESLTKLIGAASQDGIVLWIASGYRSVQEQQTLMDRAVEGNETAGETPQQAVETALRTLQKPGYSEHHTGLAVDFNQVSSAFDNSKEHQWLQAHAAEYGFIQRYTKEKEDVTGIDTESWHYRYVGTAHAARMDELGLCLEEYCLLLKQEEMNAE